MIAIVLAGTAGIAVAQASPKAPASDGLSSVQRAIDLAEKGLCSQALPLLQKVVPRLANKQMKYHAGMASARCAMSLNQEEAAVSAILLLRREFPRQANAATLNDQRVRVVVPVSLDGIPEGVQQSEEREAREYRKHRENGTRLASPDIAP